MRVSQGRGDRSPGTRLAQLKRYAFIGDSTMFGIGAAPNETLAAVSEQQFNDRLRGWPVEAVNFGISGYNLFNSWLGFKRRPQIYDGLVIALCANDADFFDRSYDAVLPEPQYARWEPTQPTGWAVVQCFDDIASFAATQSLPVAVCIYNAIPGPSLQIAQILSQLCTERKFAFVDSYAIYQERHVKREDVIVSRADAHPSALAHEIMARALIPVMDRAGWFAGLDKDISPALVDAILAAARGMIDRDEYPTDIALNWALRTLARKLHLAQRIQASIAPETANSNSLQGFFAAAADARQTLRKASQIWHSAHRIRSFAMKTAAGRNELLRMLVETEELRVRLDEIAFALDIGGWEKLSAGLSNRRIADNIEAVLQTDDAFEVLRQCRRNVASTRYELRRLSGISTSSSAFAFPDHDVAFVPLRFLFDLMDRVEAECAEQETMMLSIQSSLQQASVALSSGQKDNLINLLNFEIGRLPQCFSSLGLWPDLINRLGDPDAAAFTTIEVTVKSSEGSDKWPVIISVVVDYAVPPRLIFRDNVGFLKGDVPDTVKLRVPLFYVGKLIFSGKNKKNPVDITISNVTVYNHEARRVVIDTATLNKLQPHIVMSAVIHVQ